MRNDPRKITKNIPQEIRICAVVSEELITCSMVRYSTIVTASLKILSPNIKLYNVGSVFISFMIANTDTGSVAEINAPNAQLSLKLN